MPLTSDPGSEIQPGFSPDGNQVVYAFNEGGAGQYHLYVKAVGSGQSVRLTSQLNDDMSPARSPDGESIAFIRLGSGSDASSDDCFLLRRNWAEARLHFNPYQTAVTKKRSEESPCAPYAPQFG